MFLQPDKERANFLKHRALGSFKNKTCSHVKKKKMLKKQYVPIKNIFHGETGVEVAGGGC